MTTLLLPPPRRPPARWPRRLAAAGALAAGLASLLAALGPALGGLLGPLTLGSARVSDFDRVLAGAAAAAALLVARGVARGSFAGAAHRRAGAAAAVAAGVAAVAALASFAHPLDVLALPTVVAGIVAAYLVQRPASAGVGHSPADHARAAGLLARHAGDSLDPFALREDKAFHFSDGGFLAYRVVRKTAVVSGDPICAPGCAPAILGSFEAAAARRGWDVVLTGASPREVAGYRAAGFRVMRIGEEAVVDPHTFTLDGKARKCVRKAVGRVGRHGWTIACVRGDALDAATIAELARVETAWRAGRRRLQGFAMTLGRLWGAPEDGDSLYVLGRDASGQIGAFLRFAAYPGGLSLDAMRRLGNEPNGVNEALIVAALGWAREHDIREVSLNFAGFSHVMAPRGDLTVRERALRALLRVVHGRFQLDRLARFNERFGPVWRPRYLVHRGLLRLPRDGLRVLQAEAYVRAPRARPLAGGWKPAAQPAHLAAHGTRGPGATAGVREATAGGGRPCAG